MLTDFPIYWLLVRVSGVVSWILLTIVVLWGLVLRTRILGKSIKPTTTYSLHLKLGVAALFSLVIHLGSLLLDPFLEFSVTNILIPGTADWKPIPVAFGILALWVMLPGSVLGRLQRQMGKVGKTVFSYSHKISFLAWPLATAHYIFAGTDILKSWSIAVLATSWILITFLLVYRSLNIDRDKPKLQEKPIKIFAA